MGKHIAEESNPGIFDDKPIVGASRSLFLGAIVAALFFLLGLRVLTSTVLPANREHAALRETGVATLAVILPRNNPFGRPEVPNQLRRVPYSYFDQKGHHRSGLAMLPQAEVPDTGKTLPIRYFPNDPTNSRSEYELDHNSDFLSAALLIAWVILMAGAELSVIIAIYRHYRSL